MGRQTSPCMGLGIFVGTSLAMGIGYLLAKQSQGKPGIGAISASLGSMLALVGIAYVLEVCSKYAVGSDTDCKSCVCLVGMFYWTWRALLHGFVYLSLYVLAGFFYSPRMWRCARPKRVFMVL